MPKGQGGPVDPVQFSLDELLVIRHYGVPFISNATAKLIATGITHHILLIL